MVISDIAWFEAGAPDELREFLMQKGCVLATEEEKREQVRQAGFCLLAMFRLPEAGWWKHYYLPLLERVAELRKTLWVGSGICRHPRLLRARSSDLSEIQAGL
jgi:hypothetical protein